GLTATPPDALTTDEDELMSSLLGRVSFTIPVPALVREQFLAPYQELAWLVRPLDSEAAWLAEHDLRFTELITALHEGDDVVQSLPAWVIARIRERRGGPRDDAADDTDAADVVESWVGFQHRHPALARAGARFLASSGMQLPPGVPRGEGY